MVQLPFNFSCESCVLQVQWETKALGNIYMCSDIEVLSGQVEDCSGQCTNGAVCMNGHCQCKKGFTGKFCEIVVTVPVKTNYNLYLKYMLLFIICAIAIVLFFAGGTWLMARAQKAIQESNERRAKQQENEP